MQDLLITNGTIVTNDQPNAVLSNHAIAIEDGLIAQIAPASSFDVSDFEEVVDARGMVVMPGFINAHMHTYSSFACGFNGALPAANFEEVLENLWWRLDKVLTLEDVHASAQIACLGAIRSGTTTFIDHHASPGAVRGSLNAIAEAVKQSGLKAGLCYEVSDRDGAEVAQDGIAENVAFLERLKRTPDPQLAALFGLHASFTVGDSTLQQCVEAARPFQAGFHIHTAEDAADQRHTLAKHGKRVIQRLADAGVLGQKTICAHALFLDEVETQLLAESGSFVTHQPQSNMNNAVGVMDLLQLQRKGVFTGLGTDAMTQNMLEELRVALWQQKLYNKNPSAAFMETVDLLMTNNAVFADRLFPVPAGRLRQAHAADICILDYRPHTPLMAENFAGHLVFGLSQARVDTTIASGKVLMRNRVMKHLDEDAICAHAQTLAAAVWQRI